MKAFILDAYKKGNALRLGSMPDPVLGKNDVLIEIHAAGLNPLDAKIRDGDFKLILPYRTPLILGHDLAAKVIQVGPAVRCFKVGDEVYSRPRDGRIGTFAEVIAVDEADVALKPANLTMEEAASIPFVALTAWQALVERARLKPGQKVLTRSEAQVFRNWARLPFETPGGAVFFFGADWGYSRHPTVLVRCFVGQWAGEPGASDVIPNLKGSCLFIDYEAYKVGCSIEETPALFAGSDERHPARWPNPYLHAGIAGATNQRITADSARPETIDFMKRRGFDIRAAAKGPGSIEEGIEFLRNYDIVVHPRCEHLIDELIHYSWEVDRQTGLILPKLKDADNHVIDALRYALEGARRGTGEFQIYSAGRRTFASMPQGPVTWGSIRSQELTTKGWGTVPSRRSGI